MMLLSDYIGTIVDCQYKTASSAAVATSSNATGICVKGLESVLFLTEVLVAPTSDCTETSDGTLTIQIQYDSDGTNATGSDAVTSNAGMSCTDAVYVLSTAVAAKAIIAIEVNCSAKGLSDTAGFLFPKLPCDSVMVLHAIAIPNPGNNRLPIDQTIAVVVADD